ncbi:uncharacterized protein YecT (DUF1311 family) [Pseudoduganella lurida]|uniref:Uncharacterized protein YecT (DUF1311 family) n=1 Tax=Pseudoduganella lurida TaxID=1036180 RepID=A0A562R603_9BURK|nr:lysozyme inhibitor LprI family protein [Pseudoduganella lurida]TWI64488.1 uncharacterized protein YecT (DUF1311 family) [Pseudoduganella lurida]
MISEGFERCSPIGSYYEQLRRGATADWQGVRACAEKEKNDAVLMMLYANGLGVGRDLDRAIAHACRVDGAAMETKYRVEHLLAMKAGKDSKRFDLCDDITSGYMGGFCARITEEAHGRQRDTRYATIEKALTAAQRPSYDRLRKATTAFAKHVGNDETDLSGTARAAFAIEATAAVEDQLLDDLRTADKGELPKAVDVARADAALNAAYRKLMALPANEKGEVGDGTVTKDGIRATQRSWIAYRDAWVAFARLRYPSVPAAAWQTRLTDRRTDELKGWLP